MFVFVGITFEIEMIGDYYKALYDGFMAGNPVHHLEPPEEIRELVRL